MAEHLLAVVLVAARAGRQGGEGKARATRFNGKTVGRSCRVGCGAP